MRPLACALLAALGGAAQEPAAGVQERAGIEIRLGRERAFVGEVVDVTLRVRIERHLLRDQLIQLFRQRTDVAVRVATPWAAPPDGFDVLGAPPGFAGDASAVVDGAVAALRRLDDETHGGRIYAVFALAQRLVPTRAGTLAVPPAGLRFAWAARFEEDFFGERVPQDRQDAAFATGPVGLAVAELPAAGRPPGFTGLVGRVAASAVIAGPAAARVGEGLSLRLAVDGDGDLRPFAPPSLAGLQAFHVRGLREENEPGRRVAVYDLVALRAGTHAIPAIAVPYFDPAAARYDVAAAAPVEIAVAPAADGTTAIDAAGTALERDATGPAAGGAAPPGPAAPVPGVDVLFGLLPVARTRAQGPPDFAAPAPLAAGWLALGLMAPALAACLLWWLRRRAGSRPARLLRRRRRRALRAFRTALADPHGDRGAALAQYLATWLDCAPAAVVGPSLPERLAGAGVDRDLAGAVDAAIDRLAGVRFGGESDAPAEAALLELVARVDRQLRARAAVSQPASRQVSRPASRTAAALAVLCCASLLAQQQRPALAPDLPAEAARHFAAGDVARASGLYRQALELGTFDAAALCFDLGTCAHRLGRPAESVLWYLRALRAAPHHLESRANLRLVRQQLGLADAGDRALVRIALEGALARLTAAGAGTVLALGAALQLAGIALLWLRRRRGAATVLLAAGLALSLAAAVDALDRPGDAAVVLREGVRLLAEPHERAGALGALKAGETIAVLEASPRWARVRRGADDGWIETRTFARVEMR